MLHIKGFLFKFTAIAAFALIFGICDLNAQTDNTVGPTKPVVITNTPTNPVPVIGTITGNVTGDVNVKNTPTVKIDPTANTVVFASKPSLTLLNTGLIDVSTGGYPSYGPFDVSKSSKIRVIATNSNNSDGSFQIMVVVDDPAVFLPLDESGFVTLQPGQIFSRVYDVPGPSVKIIVGGNGSKRNGVIAVFAQ